MISFQESVTPPTLPSDIWVARSTLETDDTAVPNANLYQGPVDHALISGASLTITSKATGEIIAELEFDVSPTVACWDGTGSSIVVGDSDGTLHLVSGAGVVVFSKKMCAGSICGLFFIQREDVGALVAVSSTGSVVCIKNMDTKGICEASAAKSSELPDLLRKLQIHKVTLSVQGIVDARCADLVIALRTTDGAIHTIDANELLDGTANVNGTVIISGGVQSYQVVEDPNHGAVLIAAQGNKLTVLQCSQNKPLAQYASISAIGDLCLVSHETNSPSGVCAHVVLVVPRDGADASRAGAGRLLTVLSSPTATRVVGLAAVDFAAGRVVLPRGSTCDGAALCATVADEQICTYSATAAVAALRDKVSSALAHVDATAPPTDAVSASVRLAVLGLRSSGEVAMPDPIMFLGSFAHMTTGAEVMFLLAMVLDLPHLPEGFIAKALTDAELAIERLSAKLGATAKQRHLLEILRLHHLLETARMLPVADGEEESALRLSMCALLPENLPAALRQQLSAGRADAALIIIQRCVRGGLPLSPAETVRLIPLECPVEHVLAWLRAVVPRLATDGSNGATVLAAELLGRARQLEAALKRPFEALQCVAFAQNLIAQLSAEITAGAGALVSQVRTLWEQLSLQKALWECWQDEITLEEVAELGLKGVIFDRIDGADESNLTNDIADHVAPIVAQFNGNLSAMLQDWIAETISSKIVVAGGDDEVEDATSEGHCTLSRLVRVAAAIPDRGTQARVVLTLLQMPVLEDLSLQGSSSGTADGVGHAAQHQSNPTASTRLLCELAAQSLDSVDGVTRDALTEATKLLVIKALAAEYGVENFDPRNSKQVRSVLILIANSVHRPGAIRDAVKFAVSWGGRSVDLTAVLTRAVILRCSEATLFSTQESKFEDQLRVALGQLPEESMTVVLDDALTYLLSDLEDACAEIDYDPAQVDGALDEMRTRAAMDLRSALVLTAHFLDSTRADAAPGTRRVRYVDRKDEWITSDLLLQLRRLATLQTAHGVYLSLAELRNEGVCQSIVAALAQHRVELLLACVSNGGDRGVGAQKAEAQLTADNSPLDAVSRKACALLNVCPTYLTHTAMKLLVEAGKTELAMEVAKSLSREKALHSTSLAQLVVSGGLEGSGGHAEVDAASEKEAALLLDAALTLCTIAAKKANQVKSEDYSMMPSLSLLSGTDDAQVPEHLSFPMASFDLSRELLRCSVASCPAHLLGRTLDLLNGAETVLAVYDRVEGASSTAAASAEAASGADQGSVLSQGSFSRDGILMQASVVALPLMKYAFGEVRRRSLAQSASSAKTSAETASAPDLEDLVRVLQRSENHLLATRVLYGSWFHGPYKAQALNSSLLALCRKVLIYRDIDIPFAVACLAALPYDSMVRELKTAVPSIQSDFSRLQTVAMVGEELAHLWDQESLLLLFQGLQSNAKWWHILSTLGLKVDLKVFQSPDAAVREKLIRSIIPELFEKGHMDLDSVTEYCRQFDLEPEYAALTYTELILTAPPSGVADFSWVAKVRAAAESVQEHTLLQRLRDVLHRIHPLDYEKVRYVCNWILDLLVAEEVPEDANADDSTDYTTTSFSVRDKPQKVPTAVLLAERGVSQELETYKRYIDIVGYLSGLKFPAMATASAQDAVVGGAYSERIPLWPLLADPWSVLDPILAQMPESAAKLAPLCVPLRLDKSDFNFRKIIALYTRMTGKLSVTGTAPGAVASASHVEGKRAALTAAAEAVEASLMTPLQQMELWQWIYARESTAGDDVQALAALEAAIAVARAHSNMLVSQTKGVPRTDEETTLLSYFSSELRAHRCRCSVRDFCAVVEGSAQLQSVLLAELNHPTQLVRLMLEATSAVAWDMYVQATNALEAPVTVYALFQQGPGSAVLQFVQKAASAVDAVARHCGLDKPGEATSPTAAAAPAAPAAPAGTPQPTQLEVLRHGLIGRMLSDVDTSGNERDSATAASTISKSLHGGAADAVYNPTEAERRRREDLFLSLSIAALVLACSSTSQQMLYHSQLDSVVRGKGVRVMRRLTARSKFRAAQALFYIGHSRSPDEVTELELHRSFLYCLCELQEIRLPCSEESLLDAMGLKVSDYKVARTDAAADPRALVRTWLHDEGAHTEVVELARDLLVVTGFQEAGIWHHLVGHMTARGFRRPLFETLQQIAATPVFVDLSFGMMAAEMLTALAAGLTEAIDRADQVLSLTDGRPEDKEWLHLPASTDNARGDATGAAGKVNAKAGEQSGVQRVVLRSKLAAGPSEWEEGTPEDLVPALRSSASIALAVLHCVSSRVRGRCTAALTALEGQAFRALSVHAQHQQANVGVRSVSAAVSSALWDCARALLSPALFAPPDRSADAVAQRLHAAVASIQSDTKAAEIVALVADRFAEEPARLVLESFVKLSNGEIKSERLYKILLVCAHQEGHLLRTLVPRLQEWAKSSADRAVMKVAVAQLPADAKKGLGLRLSKLGNGATALLSALA